MKSGKRIANSFGLLGKRLDYSFSKKYFTHKFEQENIHATYENIEVDHLENLRAIITSKKITGFNVTIPYKKEILQLVEHSAEIVKEIGATNCIAINNQGEWVAHNTDVIGFEKSLLHLLDTARPKALVFGSGGASGAIQYVLNKLKIEYQLVSRIDGLNRIEYKDLNEEVLTNHKLLINTTPLGTYPNIEDCIPIPYEYIGREHFCFDLVYNPEKTTFLRKAKQQGATIKNGLEMLEIQAEESWKIWRNQFDD